MRALERGPRPMGGPLAGYDAGPNFCEMFGRDGLGLPHARAVIERLQALDLDILRARSGDAALELYNLGITFTVYTEKDAVDRILPFDIVPRLISRDDWQLIETGVQQRVRALNAFLWDIYHDAHILKDGVVPAALVRGNPYYRKEMEGFDPPHGVYVHIAGIDIVRGDDGAFHVLEDNARSPSGVSYVIENRHLMLRAFADLMAGVRIRPVSNYGQELHERLAELAPDAVQDPQVVLLSPGVFNSAYFEHVFLAREMGVPLVEGRDLVVENDRVHMRTVAALRPVDVVYRRIDDAFLDPHAFRPDSLLGVPGLMRAYRAGKVVLANAVGTGVADDKAVYAYLPRIIRYYLGEDAILPNVDTHICREPDALAHTLDHLHELVVKPVGESGGYGITVGPLADQAELESCRRSLLADPANFIAQPMIRLSVSPTLVEDGLRPRHVDLRPFCVSGRSSWVLPGGLTRVALREGSIVVNSSQGGGSKDTWVLD